jgi:hypothetical protein
MQTRPFIIVALALALSGCMNQSQIQSKYVKSQKTCRAETAKLFSGTGANAPDGLAVGAAFSDCMNKAGWRVATPKPPQVATGPVPNPPSGSPSTNPIASATAAPTETAGGISPSEGTATLIRAPQTVPGSTTVYPPTGAPSTSPSAATAVATSNPPSGAPSVNPSAAAARVAEPVAATPAPARYQPARPVSVQSAPYGSGAGRQF